ncbi:MAG: efflux RND transporter periplasmic adaptor subunit [Gemmatimonadota bacterium]
MDQRGAQRWLAAMGAAVLIVGCGGGEPQAGGQRGGRGGGTWGGREAEAAIPVRAEAVTRGEITSYIQTHARLEAERWVEVVSRAQGIVRELRVEEGGRVGAGDVLLRLGREEERLRVQQAEVTLAQAGASFERTQTLFERQLVSQEEFEATRNQLQNAQTALDEAKLSLDYTDIRAPIGGVVMRRDVELGDMVRVNQAVFAVADLEPLQARLQVPEKRVHEVREGQEARIAIDALPDRVFPARVRMINPGVDPETGTVKVTLDVPSPGGDLKPGMFATVRIITDRHPGALIISKRALLLETDEDDLFAIADGKAVRTRVELGYVDGDRVEVLTGLTEGAMVITIGQEGLKDGAPVRLAGEAAATVAEAPAEGSAPVQGGIPESPADAGRGAWAAGEKPDSAAVVKRLMDRGMSEADAVQRWQRQSARGAAPAGSRP